MKIFMKIRKTKGKNVAANNIKISLKMKNRDQLSIEKKQYKIYKNRSASQTKMADVYLASNRTQDFFWNEYMKLFSRFFVSSKYKSVLEIPVLSEVVALQLY